MTRPLIVTTTPSILLVAFSKLSSILSPAYSKNPSHFLAPLPIAARLPRITGTLLSFVRSSPVLKYLLAESIEVGLNDSLSSSTSSSTDDESDRGIQPHHPIPRNLLGRLISSLYLQISLLLRLPMRVISTPLLLLHLRALAILLYFVARLSLWISIVGLQKTSYSATTGLATHFWRYISPQVSPMFAPGNPLRYWGGIMRRNVCYLARKHTFSHQH